MAGGGVARLLLGLLVSGGLTVLGGGTGSVCGVGEDARIALEHDGNTLGIIAIFSTARPPAGELTYRLEVTKAGPAGRTSSRQGGVFLPAPGRVDTLSTMRVGVQAGDVVETRLTIHHDARTVAEAHHREVIR